MFSDNEKYSDGRLIAVESIKKYSTEGYIAVGNK